MESVTRAQWTIDSEYPYMDSLLEDRFVVAGMAIMAVLVGTLKSALTAHFFFTRTVQPALSSPPDNFTGCAISRFSTVVTL